MNNVISFSLWGDSKLYCQGAIDNIDLCSKYFPGWRCRFYVASDCPALDNLIKKCGQRHEVVVMPALTGIDRSQDAWQVKSEHRGMLWRFQALADPDIDHVIFRDVDSRLNDRDAWAVNTWIESGALAHRIHENKLHWNSQLMGGMWGMKGGFFPNITDLITFYMERVYPQKNEPMIFCDLWFLMDVIWPRINHSCIGFGYGHKLQFPSVFDYKNKIGHVENPEWRYQKYGD